jgi:hypothetical protein
MSLELLAQEKQQKQNGEFMKTVDEDTMRPEYKLEELGQGVRGKYYKSYHETNKLISLSPDVAAVFPTEESVNEALRYLIKIAQTSTNLAMTNSQ